MMDFSLTEEQRTLQDTVRRFAERELIDVARECEERDEPPPSDILKKFANMGLLGVNIFPKILDFWVSLTNGR